MRIVDDILTLNAKRFGKRKALITEEGSLTFAQLNERANRLANGLNALGVRPSDKVGILAPNSLEWVVVFYAVAKCGACLVPVNFRYKKEELIHVVNNSDASFLFFSDDLAGLVEQAEGEFVNGPQLIPLRGNPNDGTTYSKLIDLSPDKEPEIAVDPMWPLCITYTSGTTGLPKGVLASHYGFINIYIGLTIEGDVHENEVTLVSMPFFHVAGMHALLQPTFLRGGTVVLHTGSFDPEKVLYAVARNRVTMTMWVPTQLAMLLNHPSIGVYDISSLSKIWYGSSPITPPVLEGSLDRFKANFYQFYGQTETGMVSVLRPEDHYSERSQFTGRPFFNADLRIVNESGFDVKEGEVGEIISRRLCLGMIGYYKMDEANRTTVRDGWIHTGDLARLESDAYFTIVDRSKDLIISGAENIYPKEIEEAISRCPGVREVAVFGIPDDVYGESVYAAVVVQPGSRLSEEQIVNYCAGKLSGYKKPKRVVFVNELPKNASDKMTKNVLRGPF